MRSMMFATAMLLVGTCAFAGSAVETWQEPKTGMAFVAIAKGCFQMGSLHPAQPPANTMWDEINFTASLSENEKPRHEACVDAFWMSKYEVRLAEWRSLMGGEAPGAAANTNGAAPMVSVTWEQARLFARRLTEQSQGRQRFRLPTEAEWEYACRGAAAEDAAPSQDALTRQAHYGLGSPWTDDAKPEVGAVGQYAANPFGLHDMLGNAWEWTQDSYAADGYARHSLYNPRADAGTTQRVIRGGSFRTEYAQVRCTRRGHQPASEALDTIGFRLVRER